MDTKKNTIFINFDLKVDCLKSYYCDNFGKFYNDAYYDIRKFLCQNGFNHIQGSGYISKQKIREEFLDDMLDCMLEDFKWLPFCTRDIKTSKIYSMSNKYQEVMEQYALDNPTLREHLLNKSFARQKPRDEIEL